MDDLVLKLFMADSNIDNPELAEAVMLKYGLADQYIPYAQKLEPLLRHDTDDAFTDGAGAMLDVFHKICFALPPEAAGSEFANGMTLAMNVVEQILNLALDQITNSTLAPEGSTPSMTLNTDANGGAGIDIIGDVSFGGGTTLNDLFGKLFGEPPAR